MAFSSPPRPFDRVSAWGYSETEMSRSADDETQALRAKLQRARASAAAESHPSAPPGPLKAADLAALGRASDFVSNYALAEASKMHKTLNLFSLGQTNPLLNISETFKTLDRLYGASSIQEIQAKWGLATSRLIEQTVRPPLTTQLLDQLGVSVNAAQRVMSSLTGFGSVVDAAEVARRFSEQLAGPLRAWEQLFEAYEEDERLVLEALAPRGWLISPSMALPTVRAVARALEEHSVEEVEAALVRHFTPERCAAILDEFSLPAFTSLKPLMDEAIAAHAEEKHRLAILAWLACIDGICEQAFGVRRVFTSTKRKNGGALRGVLGDDRSESLVEALIHVLQTSASASDGKGIPRRHLVMHGRDVDFGSEVASIQLILVLEVLHFCAERRRDGDLVELDPAPVL